MKLSDLEDIVSVVSMEYFNYKYPDHSPVDNPNSVKTCIDESAFVINRFITHFNKLAEEELNDGR